MVSPRLIDTEVIAECVGWGYISNDLEDFVVLTGGVLCHSCYDDTVGYKHTVYLYEEEARKARVLTDAINTDYFE